MTGPAVLLLLLFANHLSVTLTSPIHSDVDHRTHDGLETDQAFEQTGLAFPPQFYAAAKSSSLNPEDFEKELHELAWTMCDFHRRVKSEMMDYEGLHEGSRHPQADMYESWLKTNPMEPTYHQTCLELFRLYPNMDREIQAKEAPVLTQDE